MIILLTLLTLYITCNNNPVYQISYYENFVVKMFLAALMKIFISNNINCNRIPSIIFVTYANDKNRLCQNFNNIDILCKNIKTKQYIFSVFLFFNTIIHNRSTTTTP